ncbi:alkane 1-monooxygenase [Alisedimentitalea sp. MJ-SS2]|uniref:alkane 1-monooxygenase n=1 Tax=Aliisedimentitalea sp. MJ-SS2 TaxID=3049795 RepID=UPI002907B89D|nr:alkane 1-monooxygenase [Alisedimentitalea sp. MJ-SS2]MDU8926039.1 alkane 1-monooxygenase [Alisedimentitalea sp. MJ-SS2]
MQMTLFAIATILPVALLCLAVLSGGLWPLAALLYMTLFTAGLDRFAPRLLPDLPKGAEFPSGKGLSVLLGLVHLGLLLVAVSAPIWIGPGMLGTFLTLVAMGQWFGQVSHPNAHELIHRPERYARYLGRTIYSSLMIGHHASAHLLVHHVHVGTKGDPNSAMKGVGFYRFFTTAWRGSFQAGLRAENALRARAQRPVPAWTHPYLGYIAMALAGLALSLWFMGPTGLLTYLFICLYAQAQILLADYVQHYGLRRAARENGKPEPVSDAHSWNSPHWFSSSLMINAPRHSDHHLYPNRPYPGLRLRAEMPILPHSLPVMAAIALIPPLWRRVMARELKRLNDAGMTG